MTHYDEYPYVDPRLYYENGAWQFHTRRTDSAPRRETWDRWFPGEEPKTKRVLIVGCGTCEAQIVAQEPLLDVWALDQSAKTIDIARRITREADINNIRFIHKNVFDYDPSMPFDVVMATGVLHHIEEADRFVTKVHKMLSLGGLFTCMVYGDRVRQFIPEFCQLLRTLGLGPDLRGIGFVRGLIASLPEHHPVKQFQMMQEDSDAQIVDIWLHPYFKQYAADEFFRLITQRRFRFQRWLYPSVVDGSLFERLPPEFSDVTERYKGLSQATAFRLGQILNHNDMQLTAAFIRMR